MGYKHPDIRKGPAAIEEWERQARALVRVLELRDKLEVAVAKKAMCLRRDYEAHTNRAVGVKEAADILSVAPSLIRHMVDDLQLLKQDLNGKIPLQDLREFFFEHGWWLLKNYRFAKRQRILQ